MFSVPFNADAGFFSSLLGGDDTTTSASVVDNNLQNMSVLQANVSSVSIAKELDSKADVNIVSENALMPSTSIMGTSDSIEDPSSDQMSVYVVRKGDSIANIAKMFDVSTNTILWANNMKKGDKLVEGSVLLILPVDGVRHIVEKGQTLKGIATKYKVDQLDIAMFNGIAEDTQLQIGDELIIPDVEMTVDNNTKNTDKKNTKNTKSSINSKVISGYFINPVPRYVRRSQGLHDRYAIDLAAPTGTAVYATAPGVVQIARYGWNGAYGNLVIIKHTNGTISYYGHLSRIDVSTGENVNRGEQIGAIGSTGRSTGPHLHFEIRGAKNPGATTPMSFAKQ